MNEKNKSRFRWFVYKKTETPFTRAKNSVRHAKVLAPCLNHFGTALPIYMTQSKRFFSSWAWFQFLIGTPSLSLFYFSFFKFTRGTVFPFLKVVSCSLRFWTAISCSLFNFTEHIKYDFFFVLMKIFKCYLFLDFCIVAWRKKRGGRIRK